MQIIKTKRLRLEPISTKHAAMVFEPLQSELIYTFIPEDPPTLASLTRRYDFLSAGKSPDGSEHWLNWVAFDVEAEVPVGTFQATLPQAETGSFAYIVFPSFWRKGIGSEMVEGGLNYLFGAFSVPSLMAEIDTRNVGSIRLVESLGFFRTSERKDADFFKGQTSHEFTYSITVDQWHARRK